MSQSNKNSETLRRVLLGLLAAQERALLAQWPPAEIEATLEWLREQLPGAPEAPERMMNFAVTVPFDQVQREGGPKACVLRILEQEDPDAFKTLGKRSSRGRRSEAARLPKVVQRRIRRGEIVQHPRGGPSHALKKVVAAQTSGEGRRPRPLQLKNPEEQAMVEELLKKRKASDGLLRDNLTHAERGLYTRKIDKLARNCASPLEAFDLTTDEVRKTQALAKARGDYAAKKERAAKARQAPRTKRYGEDNVLETHVLRLLMRDPSMSDRELVRRINELIDDGEVGDGDVGVSVDRHITRRRVRRLRHEVEAEEKGSSGSALT
jgi:hypothetical protein